jgi:hypothetical protein
MELVRIAIPSKTSLRSPTGTNQPSAPKQSRNRGTPGEPRRLSFFPHLADGVLTISGEKKTETEDKDRMFSERQLRALRAPDPG